jgi:hypothetical protein
VVAHPRRNQYICAETEGDCRLLALVEWVVPFTVTMLNERGNVMRLIKASLILTSSPASL